MTPNTTGAVSPNPSVVEALREIIHVTHHSKNFEARRANSIAVAVLAALNKDQAA